MRPPFLLHPAALAAYAAGAVACACLVTALPLQALGLAGACAACLAASGRRALAPVMGALFLAAGVAAINPLFNTEGATVLAMPFGRPYTAEALALGAQAGLMAATVLLWLAWVGKAVGPDALLRMGGRVAPRLGLVADLTAQMVPRFARVTARVAAARAAAGIALDGTAAAGAAPSAGSRVREGAAVLATVASDGLEGAMAVADSMEARGYGCGPRTQAPGASLRTADGAFLVASALLLATFCLACASGGAACAHGPWGAIAAGAYGAFALLPAAAYGAGEVRWLFLRQSI